MPQSSIASLGSWQALSAYYGRYASGSCGCGAGLPLLSLLCQKGEDLRIRALGPAHWVLQEGLVVALHVLDQLAQLWCSRKYGEHLHEGSQIFSTCLTCLLRVHSARTRDPCAGALDAAGRPRSQPPRHCSGWHGSRAAAKTASTCS